MKAILCTEFRILGLELAGEVVDCTRGKKFGLGPSIKKTAALVFLKNPA
jgi:hypothetical protein